MSPLTKRKFKFFLSQKKTHVGLLIFILFFVFSMCANLFSNDKPLILIRDYKNINEKNLLMSDAKNIFSRFF